MNFRAKLKEVLGDKVKEINRAFNIVGDIAILEIPENLMKYQNKIAKILMSVHKNIKTVVKVSGQTKGVYRIKPVKWIGGKRNFITTHKENGCLFKVNLKKVYFNPRLGTERRRIYEQVKKGEIIIDMFAGVGPFSIEIAKHTKAKKIYAIELNPDAYELLKENIKLNKVEDRVVPIHGDASKKIMRLEKANRIIMNLPKNSLEFLPIALSKIKKNGIIHLYTDQEELILPKIKIIKKQKVTPISPGKYHYRYDLMLK